MEPDSACSLDETIAQAMRELQEKASGGTNGRERRTGGLISQNHGIDSYWKRLGPESNGEYTHPQLSPKQKAAFAMSVGQLPSRKTNW
jgi:hypothetical protein